MAFRLVVGPPDVLLLQPLRDVAGPQFRDRHDSVLLAEILAEVPVPFVGSLGAIFLVPVESFVHDGGNGVRRDLPLFWRRKELVKSIHHLLRYRRPLPPFLFGGRAPAGWGM